MKKTLLALPFVFFALLITIFAFWQKSHHSSGKKILRFAIATDVSTFHPAFSTSSTIINASNVIPLVFEGLTRRGENDVPQLATAERVEISEDGMRYEFFLRETFWSDGHPVTAYDFAYALKRSIDPTSKVLVLSPYYYHPIKNAKLCMEGKVSIEKVGIKAVDDKRLVIDLEYPSPYFLEIVSSPMYLPAPKHIAEGNEQWAKEVGFVCNGPFTLASLRHGQEITLSRSPTYWDMKHVYLDGVHISIIPEMRTVLNLFIKKELDWIGSPFQRISYDLSLDLDEWAEDATVMYLLVNVDKPFLKHKKIRRALSLAIDREAITHNVFDFSASPSASPLPISMALGERCSLTQDESVAKQLFLEALEELELLPSEFPEIQLSYLTDNEAASRIAQAVQDQWRTVLGLQNVTLTPREYTTHYSALTKRDFDLGLTNWTTFVFDPVFILNDFKDKALPMNKTNWEHPKYRDLLDRSDHTLDKRVRNTLLQEAEKMLIDEVPIIPICSLKKRFAKNPSLKGEVLSKVQFVDFKSAYFEED